MSAKEDLKNSPSFEDFFNKRRGVIAKNHKHSVSSWFKSRVKRTTKARGAIAATGKATAPTATVLAGAGVAAKIGENFAPLPAIGSLITLGTFAYGKYKGRKTNEMMTAKYKAMGGEDGHFNPAQLTMEECCRFIGWFAYDGLVQMTETIGKFNSAMNDCKNAITRYNAARSGSDARMKAYLEVVDTTVYVAHRMLRMSFYFDMLALVTKEYQRHAMKTISGKNLDMFYKNLDKMESLFADFFNYAHGARRS